MDRVLLIHSGVAESWTQMHDGQKDNVWLYTGRGAADGTDEEAGNAAVARAARLGQLRGCIIGGTALVEPDVLQKPYPTRLTCR